MRGLFRSLLAALVLALAGCAAPRPSGTISVVRHEFANLPGWSVDRIDQAMVALNRSCRRITALPPERPLGPAVFGTAGEWQPACVSGAAIPAGDNAAARAFIERHFTPLAVLDGDATEGLFTGYFEPLLRGSRTRGGNFQTPLHARPDDLVTVELGRFREAWRSERIAGRVVDGALTPYDTRAEIDQGSLARRARVLAWVADPIDAFFLHIQGSGRVVLAEGGELRAGFAAQNGHAYVPIGRVLIERGVLTREQVSMQSIRTWLAGHPEEARAVLHANPSYVFFRELTGDGPLGSEGVALTPGRSLAVDRTQIAMGAPIWLDAEDPLDPDRRLQRLLVAQDTGGAIRGIVRGDVFWGAGEEAAERAGKMRARGRFWVLLPVAVARRLDAS